MSKSQLLFTSGPLSTSATVKQAMQQDLWSRDDTCIQLIQAIRESLLRLAGAKVDEYTAVLMQGSGTFSIESVISSLSPQGSKWLVLINGTYAERLIGIMDRYGIANSPLYFDPCQSMDFRLIPKVLEADLAITHVMVVHCETSTGMINDIEKLGQLCTQFQKCYVIDAVSSFGGIPIDVYQSQIDCLISSPNKCLHAVAGFAFVICKVAMLQKWGQAPKTHALDLFAQWEAFEKTGQFRFTPPVHNLLALQCALDELEQQGGIEKRLVHYQLLQTALVKGMEKLGVHPVLPRNLQGPISTLFYYPDSPNFDFHDIYAQLRALGFIIYRGDHLIENTFRLGTIGHLTIDNIHALLAAFAKVL